MGVFCFLLVRCCLTTLNNPESPGHLVKFTKDRLPTHLCFRTLMRQLSLLVNAISLHEIPVDLLPLPLQAAAPGPDPARVPHRTNLVGPRLMKILSRKVQPIFVDSGFILERIDAVAAYAEKSSVQSPHGNCRIQLQRYLMDVGLPLEVLCTAILAFRL